MLSPKAMAQPTMMMARLAVLATECLRAQIPVAWATLGGGGLEHPRQWPKAPEAASPLRVPSHLGRQARPEKGTAKGVPSTVLRCVTPEIFLSARVETSLYR